MIPEVLYKYTTVDTARLILSTGKIRLSSPLRFNDPLDTQWDPEWVLKTDQAKEILCSIVDDAICDPGQLPKATSPEVRRRYEAYNKKPSQEWEAIAAREVLKYQEDLRGRGEWRRELMEIIMRQRMFCVSAVYDSILMWSHYADQHRGVVLGFHKLELEKGIGRNGRVGKFSKVMYANALPDLLNVRRYLECVVYSISTSPTKHVCGSEWALTKFTNWMYENEWRYMDYALPGALGDCEEREFPRFALVEVIAGCRTDQAKARELRTLAYPFNSTVQYSSMMLHPTEFKLVRQAHGTA